MLLQPIVGVDCGDNRVYKWYDHIDLVYTAGSSTAGPYTPAVNIDEYSTCQYYTYADYKLNSYMQN